VREWIYFKGEQLMIEIRIHGRGGQGAVIASRIIAEAAFYSGMHVQAFPAFGSERRGAPVTAFIRLDSRPILVRSEVYAPDGLIVLDHSLITLGLVDITRGLKPDGWILINSTRKPDAFPKLQSYRVATVDASGIAASHGLGTKTAPMIERFLGDFALSDDFDFCHAPRSGKRVAVIGAGPTGVTAAYLLAIVGHEVEEAIREGIPFCFLASPSMVVTRNHEVIALECLKMELGAPDESGRRAPVPVPGSQFLIAARGVVTAIVTWRHNRQWVRAAHSAEG
jgi:pyruvate ferredoxin oxidoreductase gamma subunit/2-oxoisovalerate ferredoxin oxidoreductase gamma subunit